MKNKQKTFSIRDRIKSFAYAFSGIRLLLYGEHNMRIHLLAACVAIGAAFFFRVAAYEWLAIVLSIGLVISLEAINTAIEELADFVSPKRHPHIKKTKDIAAAAVLISAIAALAIGLIIFLPKLCHSCI